MMPLLIILILMFRLFLSLFRYFRHASLSFSPSFFFLRHFLLFFVAYATISSFIFHFFHFFLFFSSILFLSSSSFSSSSFLCAARHASMPRLPRDGACRVAQHAYALRRAQRRARRYAAQRCCAARCRCARWYDAMPICRDALRTCRRYAMRLRAFIFHTMLMFALMLRCRDADMLLRVSCAAVFRRRCLMLLLMMPIWARLLICWLFFCRCWCALPMHVADTRDDAMCRDTMPLPMPL